MNPPKPTKTHNLKPCRECGGKFELVQTNHIERTPSRNAITIPLLWVYRCNQCGDILFPAESVHHIENAVLGRANPLTGPSIAVLPRE